MNERIPSLSPLEEAAKCGGEGRTNTLIITRLFL